MRPLWCIGTAAAASLALASQANATRVNVYVFDFDFSINQPLGPIEDAVVSVGDEVFWIPLDDFHTTTACVGQAEFWDSGIMSLFDVYSHIFTTPGTYNYYCIPHGQDNGDGTATGMAGSITVVPAPGPMAVLVLAAGAATAWRRRRPATFAVR